MTSTFTFSPFRRSAYDLDETVYTELGRYRPMADVTPYEVALLIPIFAHAASAASGNMDYVGYIARHNLGRHFQK